jgi:hypothetical protein
MLLLVLVFVALLVTRSPSIKAPHSGIQGVTSRSTADPGAGEPVETSNDRVPSVSPDTVAEPLAVEVTLGVLYEGTRDPVEGVTVRVLSEREDLSRGLAGSGLTDEEGQLVLSLVPGAYVVLLNEAHRRRFTLARGGAHVYRFFLARARGSGRVVDHDGLPVAEAKIWSSSYGSRVLTKIVGESDADGRFGVAVAPGHFIAARHEDYLSSEVHRVHLESYDAYVLQLPQGSPARIGGAVISADGALVPNATVTLQPRSSAFAYAERSYRAPAIRVRTAGDGRFLVHGLQEEQIEITVKADGFLASQCTYSGLAAGCCQEIELEVHSGYNVEGLVLGKRTLEPIPDVRVTASTRRHQVTAAVSDSQGKFELKGLPPEKVWVQGRSATGEGRLELDLSAGGGDWPQLRLMIEETPSIRGILVDQDEAPLVGWMIGLRPGNEAQQWDSWSSTDSEGRFALSGCHWSSVTLEVRMPDDWLGPLILSESDVPCRGGEETRLAVNSRDWPTQVIKGRVLLSGSMLPPDQARLLVVDKETQGTCTYAVEARDGSYITGPLPRHSKAVVFSAPRAVSKRVSVPDHSGAVIDLGLVTLTECGGLKVTSQGLGTLVHCRVESVEEGSRLRALLHPRSSATFDSLAPGAYRVWYETEHGGRRRSLKEVTIVSGEISEMALEDG